MTRRKRCETTAATRDALLNAATAVFKRLGFARTTIEAIVAEAGFTRGAFYAHFTAKDDVLLAVVTGLADEAIPVLTNKIKACSTQEQVISVVADWALQRSRSQDIALLMLEASRIGGTANSELPTLFSSRWTIVGDALATFFPDRDSSISGEELIAIVVGLTYGPVGSGMTGHDVKRLVTIVLKALLQGQQRRDDVIE